MDWTTIIIVVAVAAIIIFLWPRIGTRRSGANPVAPPQVDRGGVDMPNSRVSQDYEDEVVSEAEEDVKSQDRERSI